MDVEERLAALRRIQGAWKKKGPDDLEEICAELRTILDEVAPKKRKARASHDRNETGGHDRSEGSEE